MIKVSVIIPVYKASLTIEKCARSLFSQTLTEIEFLFIDDCTPDNSIDVIKKVLEDFPHRMSNTIIQRMQSNSGQAKVREWGMRNATGEYIIHCDSDDWVDIKMYESMYKAAKCNDADIVFCNYNKVLSDTTIIKFQRKQIYNSTQSMVANILAGYDGYNQLWANLVKKELINNIEYPEGNLGEDWDIMLQVLLKAKQVTFLDEAYYYYAYNPASITNNINPNSTLRCVEHLELNIRHICKILERNGLANQYAEELVMTKFKPKNILWTLLYDKRCRERWYTLFPEIDAHILTNKYVPSKFKFKQALMQLHLGCLIGFYQKLHLK